MLIRKPFPISKINMVLQELEGFIFALALDLNMGYYTIRLDPDALRICTIIFPWGNYSYKRLLMGMGLTKHTFCGIILFKLNTFLSHVFAYP
jgi:hypothetical protein